MVQVAVDAADPEVVEQHLLAGDRGQQVADLVALDEAVQDRGQAAEVERHPAHEQGVARDPVELAREHPDVLGAARDLDVEQLLERHHRRPLAEQRAHVLERVDLADDLVVVRVLAQLLDAAVEVAEDGVEVDDALAADLEHDAQHPVGRRVLGAHVEEHLAVAERVELGLALGARRVRRDGLEVPDLVVEHHPRVVRGRVLVGRGGGGHRQAFTVRRTMDGVACAGTWVCSMWRTPPPGERGGVVGQVEVLAQREARVVGRHVDPPQVAVALEDDPEHVVGLALHPLRAGPQAGDRGDARVVAGHAVRDHPQPVRGLRGPEVVDDLHVVAGVDAGEVGEDLEAELRVVVDHAHDVDQVRRCRCGSRSGRGAGGAGP